MSPRRRLPFVLLIVCALALVVTGCGDGVSKDDYEKGLRNVQSQLEKANDASQDASKSDDPAARTAALQQAQASIDKAADAAEALEPPDDAQAEHEQLSSALRDYATLFSKLATLSPNADPAQQTELYGQAGEIVERLDAANRALKKAGYSVPRKDDE